MKSKKMNLTEDGKKTRVQRYCPRLDKIDFKLLCEWSDCDYISSNMDDYLKHIDQHINQHLSISNAESKNDRNSYSLDCKWRECDMDNSKFDSISTFERHIRYHAFHTKLKFIGKLVIENVNKIASQENCKINKNVLAINLNYILECSLDSQSRNLIPELPYKFECSWDKCEYNTDNPELFYRHIKEHVIEVKEDFNKEKSKKIEKYSCLWNDCTSKISGQNRLVEHMRHHSQEKLVACHICGALFSTFTRYIDHCSRSNANSQPKDMETKAIKFQCSHCNKKFLTNNLLKEHLRKHINKYKCDICDMTCITKHDLKRHVLYKHSDEKPFKCEFCDKYSAKTANDLNKHIQLKHVNNREYQCNDCEYKTKNLNLMKKHMVKIHLNQAKSMYSYKCHECDKTYSYGTTLSQHLKLVHNYKWPSGHSRFRYKLDNDGFYRLQTLRYESVELVDQINRERAEKAKEQENQNKEADKQNLFHFDNILNGDRENDFDDEDDNMDYVEEDSKQEMEENENDEDNDDDDDEDEKEEDDDDDDIIIDNENDEVIYNLNYNYNQTQSDHQQQQEFNSLNNTNNFKAYLIKRLIDDENKVKKQFNN